MALKPFHTPTPEPNYIRICVMFRGKLVDSFHFNQMCDEREDLDTLLQVLGKAIAAHTGQPVQWMPGMGGRMRQRRRGSWGPPTVSGR